MAPRVPCESRRWLAGYGGATGRRFGSLADISVALIDVRFTPESRHR
jgi:hypothetical protein